MQRMPKLNFRLFYSLLLFIRQGYPYFKRVQGDPPTVSRGVIVVCDSRAFPLLSLPICCFSLLFKIYLVKGGETYVNHYSKNPSICFR